MLDTSSFDITDKIDIIVHLLWILRERKGDVAMTSSVFVFLKLWKSMFVYIFSGIPFNADIVQFLDAIFCY